MGLAAESITTDIHCVTRWSKLDTAWRGVSLDTLLSDIETEADFAMALSYGGYTTNLPLEDLLDGKAWIAYEYDGDDLPPSTAGRPGCWSRTCTSGSRRSGCAASTDAARLARLLGAAGYHDYGDPWREQRYQGD